MARTKKIKTETPEQMTEIVQEEQTVGLVLKTARNKRKRDIQRIADKLRIRVQYLEALENSDYTAYPGQVYAIGFLKSYAEFLGLDVDALVERYKKETAFLEPAPLIMPIPERQVLFPHPRLIFGGLFLVLLVWGVWYFWTYPAQQTPALPPIVEEETLALTPGVPDVAPVSEPSPENQEVPLMSEPVEEILERPQEPVPPRVEIVATQEVWLEISEEDTIILSKILKPGEHYEVPSDASQMLLKTGNAGGMEIWVDGQKLKALGPVGAVRSNISLDPEKLKNR